MTPAKIITWLEQCGLFHKHNFCQQGTPGRKVCIANIFEK